MSKHGPGDQGKPRPPLGGETGETSINEGPFDPSDVGGPVEEATVQGASFLVERITPVPPRGPARMDPTRLDEPVDLPTASVHNPGARPPPQRAPDPSTGPVRIDPASIPKPGGGLAPMAQSADAPPDVDTAYVPLPGQAAPAPAQVQAPAERATVIAQAIRPARNLLDRLKASKNARLGIIAGGGVLGILLTFLVFRPSPPRDLLPPTVLNADPVPAADTRQPAQKPPQDSPDPAKIEERDQLLEKAILAVEAGRTDEALAIFRRYTEEESTPAAEFMVQLLQMQLSQSGKEQ